MSDPVLSDASHQVELLVAKRIADLRAEKGLTLSAMAARAGLSTALLSRVEHHQTGISLSALAKVASALGVPIAAFFNEADTQPPIVIHRGEGERSRLRDQLDVVMPAASKRGKLMEPILVDIPMGTGTPPMRAHPGEEVNHLLSGAIDFHYGNDVHRLSAGDTIYFEAHVPHGVHGVGGPARLLAVVASRDYLFHGDISTLLNEDMPS